MRRTEWFGHRQLSCKNSGLGIDGCRAQPPTMCPSFMRCAFSAVSARLALLCCAFLFLATRSATAFPSEEEVRSRLHQGMTVEEVVAALGEPSTGRPYRCLDCQLKYFAPINSLEAPKMGYIGVAIIFKNGRVRDWEIYQDNPSYQELQMPRFMKWELWIAGSMIALGIFLRMLLRRTPAGFMSYQSALAAYAARKIPTRQLPADFQFITHDTTLQEVLAKVGPCSREVKLPVDPSVVGGFGVVETKRGAPAILTFEYDLPYSAAVIVMPEYPFEAGNRIRAVLYRPLDVDLADFTGR